MRLLKGCVFNELSRLNIDSIDETHIVVSGVKAELGDICLLIGSNNDAHNLMLERIEDNNVDNNGRIYNLIFDDSNVKIPVTHTLHCKFFGVYE